MDKTINPCKKSKLSHLTLRNVNRNHRLDIWQSPFTGRYIMESDASPAEKEFIAKFGTVAEKRDFSALRDAYKQFDNEGCLSDELRQKMLWEIVWLFHQNFSLVTDFDVDAFFDAYPFFAESVLKLVKYELPPLVKADLCRHAGLFSKCLNYVGEIPIESDERLLMEEVCKLAADGNRYPIRFRDVWNFLSVMSVKTSPFVYWFYEEFLY